MNPVSHPISLIRALREIRGYFRRASFLTACLLTIGCGGSAEGPTVVSEDVKQQQVKELQEQRASEWGPAKKK